MFPVWRSTYPPVHSLVAKVMGDLGTPDLFIQPGASPHGYSLRPSEAKVLNDADVVVWVSNDLTPWLSAPIANLGKRRRASGTNGRTRH